MSESKWERLPVHERAGTPLDWRTGNVIAVTGPMHKGPGTQVHGYLDQRQRVYQSGGELKNFMYWKERLLTLAYPVWQQIQEGAAWIELIDHELNQCYRIEARVARAHGHIYNAGIGPRWGVPREYWTLKEN